MVLSTVFPGDDEDDTSIGSGWNNSVSDNGNHTSNQVTTVLSSIGRLNDKPYVANEVTTAYPAVSDSDLFPNYTASKTILAVVTVIAILALVLFALATVRYWFSHKGSYYVTEFTEVQTLKKKPTKMVNIHELQPSKEWLL
uniref:Uncharacterized LOC101242496 n=1 Tax=Ciona intestinalis TaxID=7719 RepID=H2XUP6_CIOIN|nr:uncharacterized protein LOC101242496 [Ciona intestinalis]|eukprot:XP_004227374.1 uncharacterized protein LOC101242496 [Ciona intestinalis]